MRRGDKVGKPRPRRSGSTVWLYGILIVFFAATVAAFFSLSGRQRSIEAWVIHSHRVISQVSRVTTSVARVSSLQHEVLLDDRGGRTRVAQEARARRREVRKLADLLQANPEQARRIRELTSFLTSRDNEWAWVLQSLAYGKIGPNLRRELAEKREAGTEKLFRILESIAQSEQDLLRVRQRSSADNRSLLNGTFGVCAGLLVMFFLVFVLDTRERIGSQRQLLREEQRESDRLQRILESISDAFLSVDRDWRFTYANGRAAELLRHTADGLLGKVLWEEFPSMVGTAFEMWYRTAMEERETVSFLDQSPGSGRWFEVRVYPSEDGITIYFQDVTEKLNAERTLQEASAFQRAALAAAGYAVITVSPDGIIQTFNAAAEALLGFRAEELIDKESPGIFHDHEEVALRAAELTRELGREVAPGFEAFVALARTGKIDQREWTYVRKDGSRVAAWLAISAITDTEGNHLGFMEIAEDITERKAAQRLVEKSRDSALDLAHAKSQFLANMSHEIRTPMNGVIGMAELLESTPLNEQQRRYLGVLKGSSETLLRVINDILDLSRMEAGKMSVEAHPSRLGEQVDEVVSLFAGVAREKGLTLSVEGTEKLPTLLLFDPTRVKQVLGNLIGNALKFTADGEVRVKAELLSAESQRALVRLSVKDTGIGIHRESLQSIFESFNQGDGSTQRRFGGTGLGLTISKRLVELMGGRIGVESELGVGSTFWIELPLVAVASEVDPVPSTASTHPDECLRLRVLLAEDDSVNVLVATSHLSNIGCEVEVAENGAEAVRKVAEGGFDIVMMDVHMPVLDGLSATRQIRAEEAKRGGHTTILGVSASAMKEDVEACLTAGMDGILNKPFSRNELVAALTRWSEKGGE
jgi:PAS domain S-box-containing protein